MELVTWNIQWGLGLDGRVDLARIVKTARDMADLDVFCVQEVADNFPDLDDNDDADQFAELSRLLPGFTRVEVFGSPAVNWVRVDVTPESRQVFRVGPGQTP